MIHLFLALIASFSVALMLRWVEKLDQPRLVVIASNYITATLLAVRDSRGHPAVIPPDVMATGIGLGLLFLAGFLVFGLALRREGMAAAVTMGRISLIIPVLAAIVAFKESPNLLDFAALVLVLLTLWTWEGRGGRPAPVLLLLFFLFGTMNAIMKWFAAMHPDFPEGRFLGLVFGAALAGGWLIAVLRKPRFSAAAIGLGLILGLPNYYSSYFLVRALEQTPAFVVFPVVDTGVIVLSALAGMLIFRETLTQRRRVSLATAIAALILLGISRGYL